MIHLLAFLSIGTFQQTLPLPPVLPPITHPNDPAPERFVPVMDSLGYSFGACPDLFPGERVRAQLEGSPTSDMAPQAWAALRSGYERGRAAQPLAAERCEQLAGENLVQLEQAAKDSRAAGEAAQRP